MSPAFSFSVPFPLGRAPLSELVQLFLFPAMLEGLVTLSMFGTQFLDHLNLAAGFGQSGLSSLNFLLDDLPLVVQLSGKSTRFGLKSSEGHQMIDVQPIAHSGSDLIFDLDELLLDVFSLGLQDLLGLDGLPQVGPSLFLH
jgi:hypothetical protein